MLLRGLLVSLQRTGRLMSLADIDPQRDPGRDDGLDESREGARDVSRDPSLDWAREDDVEGGMEKGTSRPFACAHCASSILSLRRAPSVMGIRASSSSGMTKSS